MFVDQTAKCWSQYTLLIALSFSILVQITWLDYLSTILESFQMAFSDSLDIAQVRMMSENLAAGSALQNLYFGSHGSLFSN